MSRNTPEVELLKRVGRYKKPPTIRAMRTRMSRFCGGETEVEVLLTGLVRDGKLRVTSGVFYLPQVIQ